MSLPIDESVRDLEQKKFRYGIGPARRVAVEIENESPIVISEENSIYFYNEIGSLAV